MTALQAHWLRKINELQLLGYEAAARALLEVYRRTFG